MPKFLVGASKLALHVQAQTDRLEGVGHTYTAVIQGLGCMPGREKNEMTNCGPWTHYYFGTKAISPDAAYLQPGTCSEAVPISTG